jgi:hypothetical protein
MQIKYIIKKTIINIIKIKNITHSKTYAKNTRSSLQIELNNMQKDPKLYLQIQ